MSMRPTQAQVDILKRLGAATVYEAQGQRGALDAGIKPVFRGARLVGCALTVEGYPGDNLVMHYALTRGRPGDVLVVDAKGWLETGHMGDVMSFCAKTAGFTGIVMDGAVRDAAVLEEMQFPVFSRGLSIKAPTKNQPGKVGVPIICGGVLLHPGDILVGDDDGIVAVAAESLAEVIDKGEERERYEAELREKIAEGATTFQLGALEERARRVGIL